MARWFGRVKTGSIPKTWYRSKVLLIPKKEGSLLSKEDFGDSDGNIIQIVWRDYEGEVECFYGQKWYDERGAVWVC